MRNVPNGSNCNLKAIFFFTDTEDFQDCSNIQHSFTQYGIEEGESNCHPKEIDVPLICSAANLK